MRILILLTLIFYVLPEKTSAQIGEVQKVQAGEYFFTKGEVLVTFSDTVEPEFIKKQFQRLGVEILNLRVEPITAKVSSNLPDSILMRLSEHPYILSVNYHMREFSEKAFQEMIERKERTKEEIQKLRKSFKKLSETKFPYIIFKYNVTEEMAKKVVEDNLEFGVKLNIIEPRTAVVKTEIGKEQEIMEKLNQLKYVENTAFIAILQDQN